MFFFRVCTLKMLFRYLVIQTKASNTIWAKKICGDTCGLLMVVLYTVYAVSAALFRGLESCKTNEICEKRVCTCSNDIELLEILRKKKII